MGPVRKITKTSGTNPGGALSARSAKSARPKRSALDDFEWEVDIDGYRLVIANEPVAPNDLGVEACWIGAYRGTAEAVRNTRRYKVGSFPLLFQSLADTATTPGGMLTFANRYGFLGFVDSPRATESLLDEQGRHSNWELESAETWAAEILRMRCTIEAWRMIRVHDHIGLTSRIRLDEARDVLLYVVPHSSQMDAFPLAQIQISEWHIAAANKHSAVLERYKKDEDPLLPARTYVQQVINDKLHGQVSAQVRWDADEVDMVLHAMPATLLGALWLQLAMAVAAKSTMHPCERCGAWMELGLGGARPNKRYCSDSCRTAASRERRSKPLKSE